jgi:hypothetical protein
MKNVLKQGKISRLHTDKGRVGMSNETHLVEHMGNKYVLRTCKDEQRAEYYVNICSSLGNKGFLPQLMFRQGNNILFEYLEGRDCVGEDAINVAYEIGRIYGLITQLPKELGKSFDIDKKFSKALKYLVDNQTIDKNRAKGFEIRYHELRKKVEPKISMDLTDPTPANFRLSNGNVYLADIHAIRSEFKGRGIAKLFLKWFKKRKYQEEFRKGYNSTSSLKFLTPEYLQFIYLHSLVPNTRFKSKINCQDLGKNLELLDKLLKGRLK